VKGVSARTCEFKELPIHALQSTRFEPVGVVVLTALRDSATTPRTVIVYLPLSSLKTSMLIDMSY
jgi:hypothetical protein